MATNTSDGENLVGRAGWSLIIDNAPSPGCTPPYAPAWIAEMVRHRADSETSRPARKKATRR